MDAFTVSNDLLEDPERLRERAAGDGYLFFRGLADLDLLYALRRHIIEMCAEAGWVDVDTDLMDGVAAPGVSLFEGNPAYMAVYNRIMKLEAFHRFAHQPAILGMLGDLFNEPAFVHPRNIARIIFPNLKAHTTPAHQDYIHIQGTPDTWTAWIPLGDCPQQLGSLAILAGSHCEGLYPVQPSLGAGGLRIDTESMPYQWVASDFESGDVVFFHSLTVHRGLPNESANRLRLSVDYRYQPASHPIVADSLLPHFAQVTWEEVYEGWSSNDYQHYWKSLPLNVVERKPRELAVPGGYNG